MLSALLLSLSCPFGGDEKQRGGVSMSKQTKRYIVADKVTEDSQKFRVGFSLFNKLCRNAGTPVKAILLVPTKHYLDDDTSLADFLCSYNSRAIVEDLREGREVILPCGVPFSLETTLSFFSGSSETSIVLTVNTSAAMLAKIDESQNVQAVVVVPGKIGDVWQWKQEWNPIAVSDY
jgi:hypothetical protein